MQPGKPATYLEAQAGASGTFRLQTDFQPQGDQAAAIDKLVAGLADGRPDQVLLGVTGSGKTFTIAKVIEAVNRPTLVLSHNKTLAAQLYQEFRSFFPQNAVEYFVSYYDYYQPEAYVPQTDTYIEKETSRNEEIDKLRLAASKALFERRDVIVVASVSCIYGLGAPESYYDMLAYLEVGETRGMPALLAQLVEMQYERTNLDLTRGAFRVRGDVLEIQPAYEDTAVRVEFFGDEIEKITRTDPLRGTPLQRLDRLALYPRTFYATPRETLERAIGSIRIELDQRLAELSAAGRLLEAQRLHQRTMFDLEMIKELGYCNGIENYSRHLSGRAAGEPPPTLLDYFPKDFLLVVDESHVTLPQVRGMFFGDRSRKQVLVDYGFRLPSALDNRPLTNAEFRERIRQTIAVSATPAAEELERAGGEIVEQVIRPTGLLDPLIEIRPVKGQVDDLLGVAREAAAAGERVLVTTLTKRMAEELTNYFSEVGVTRPLSPFRHRDPGPRQHPFGLPARRVRRSHRHQPAPGGPGSSGGRRRGDPGRRQGGISPQRDLPHPDGGPRGAQPEGPRPLLRRRRHRLDEAGDRGDDPPAHHPGDLQRRARHRAGIDRQAGQLAARADVQPRLLRDPRQDGPRGSAGCRIAAAAPDAARKADEGGRQGARFRAGRGLARRDSRLERAGDLPSVTFVSYRRPAAGVACR